MSKTKTLDPEAIRLDVGGGNEPRAGFTNVDLFYDKADIKAPAWDLPYLTGSVTTIFCSHMLEHVEKRKVMPVLREFHRVLKPGGLLVLEVPDLIWCCQNWLKTTDNGWNLDCLYGNQDSPGQFHMTGFSSEILHGYLVKAGFPGKYYESAPFTHNQKCIHVEVYK